ncbi:MAG: hypothetical protein ACHREM_10810, partial [Polyangiales bacterium]
AVRAMAIPTGESRSEPLTVSVGVAELCTATDSSPQAWLMRADDDLYRAKALRRAARAAEPAHLPTRA